MKQITLKIPVGSAEEIYAIGDYVRVKTSSVPVRIEVGGGIADATIEQGDALNLKPFERVRVSHSDAAEQTITLLIGNGTSADSARVGGSVSVSGDVGLKGSTLYGKSVVAIGTVSSWFRGPPPTPRKWLFLQNIGTTTIFVNFDSAAVLNACMRLLPGDSFLMDSNCPNSPMYAISDAAGGQLYYADAY